MDMPAVAKKAIAKAVGEYINRVVRLYETRQGASTDKMIDCPKCSGYRGMINIGDREWVCGRLSCRFKLPYDYSPPSEGKIFEYLDVIERNRAIDSFLVLADQMGVTI